MKDRFRIGDKIKIISNSNNNNYVIGKEYILKSMQDGYWKAMDPLTGWEGNCIDKKDMVSTSINDLENLNIRIGKLEKELEHLTIKKLYLEEENKEIIEPNDFFAWYLIKTLNSFDSDKKEKIVKMLEMLHIEIDINKLNI